MFIVYNIPVLDIIMLTGNGAAMALVKWLNVHCHKFMTAESQVDTCKFGVLYNNALPIDYSSCLSHHRVQFDFTLLANLRFLLLLKVHRQQQPPGILDPEDFATLCQA